MTSSWFINFEAAARPDLRLFCFPFAGGSAAVFRDFAGGLPAGFEVWAANLPGHGGRLLEKPVTDLKLLALEVAKRIEPLIWRRPFALFGYSLGALLAFEVARVLRVRGRARPLHLYVAAAAAPGAAREKRGWHTLPDSELLQELRKYNGLPLELLQEPDVLALFLPALRADLAMHETAIYEAERPFSFPITAFGGNQDPLVNVKELSAWQYQTSGPFQLTLFDGDHFFLRTAQTAVMESVGKIINT